MRNLLLYALGAGGMCYLAVLYRSRGVLALGIFVLLLSPVFMYLLQSVGRRMECGLFYSAYPDGMGKYRVWIEVENPTSIAIPILCAKVVLRHRATGRVCKVKLRGRIEAGQSACLEGGLERPEFGQWQMECKGLCCYDWLGIYRFWKKLGDKKQIILFPECYQTTVRAGVRTRLFSSESERYHPQMNGDDPAETLELREYQKGDRLNRIHWKLSAKQDSLMVASMGLPMGCNVVFFLDAEIGEMPQADGKAFWEVVNSISQEMLRQECSHYLAWYGKEGQKIMRKAVRCPEELSEFWGEILREPMGRCAFGQLYGSQFKGEAYACGLSLNQNLEITCNGRLLETFRPAEVREQLLRMELML